MYVEYEPDPVGTILLALFLGGIYLCNYIWENFAIVRIAYFIASVSFTLWVVYKVVRWVVNKIRYYRYKRITKRFTNYRKQV